MKPISLRMLSMLLAAIALIIAGVSVWLSSKLLETNILEFLGTNTLPPQFQQQLTDIIIGQGIITAITFIVAAILIVLLLEQMVVKPLNLLSQVIQQFGSGMKAEDIPDPKGAPHEIDHIFETFTSMAKHVEESRARDEEMSRIKSDFISTAAHQLRTPLTGIRWALEAMAKEPMDEGKKAVVNDALEKNKQLIQIVRTLLDVSAIESGRYNYKFESVSLPDLINTTIDQLHEHATRQQVNVRFEAPKYAPDIKADKERLRWVLINLIENAIRYTPKDGAVTVSIEPVKDRVFVYVHDTGIGIPDTERNNIFERFYRGKEAAKMQNGGNGLGLYIARNVVRDHGGDLDFKSNVDGVGTTFFFSVPTY
ncbi:MAG: sensor histidine kinase [Patescibacteria group bacterium UBA2103]